MEGIKKQKEAEMLKKKPTEKSFKWENKVQAFSTLILTTIAIISIVFNLGKAQEKLENLEAEKKTITTEIKEINASLKTFYTREDAEKDFAIRDRL
ncbi:MAG: hypothetical protein EWV50_05360 [Microcystis aeruginosa Ma_MB_F_20061100_S20]|uniref:Uncharacterized protein n=1 Tax=Microcystis aeruginosa Ma_MB_F_20061100_S20D TaxID=2486253 RepID=A0A552EYX7_MICAE|nr:MAG: hypothetical protein EWV78_02680 [Microcystis aeruginosa Ma_MB_F_20061100_S20D]TRU41597.1 MAG: hypothetical protein EWV50_05360 [Microcystis aeruginosa Ma_MB_F_20061100_S20]